MGNTKFERFIFTFLMCTFMVIGMSFYNVILEQGFKLEVIFNVISHFPLVFAVALFLDVLIVGPIAKKSTFKWFDARKPENKVKIILSISIQMVTMMVLLMSFFATFLLPEGVDAFVVYPGMVVRNFLMALPLNLLLVAPVARLIHLKLFPEPALEGISGN